jgi:hypothetical protein
MQDDRFTILEEKLAALEQKLAALEQKLAALDQRNRRVEADKAWETSHTRKVAIGAVTYAVSTAMLSWMGDTRFLVSALVPVAGFILSAQTLPVLKKHWTNRYASKAEAAALEQ